MTTANLGFAIDSSQAAGAASDLDRLTSSATKAEQAAGKTGAAGTRMSASFAGIGPNIDRLVAGIDKLNATSSSISAKLDAMARSSTTAARAARGIGDAANDAGKGIDSLADKLKKVPDAARSFGDQSAHVAAFRSEIERLSTKFQPLQTAAKLYEANINEIQRAHKLGVISADQMTAALDKEASAYRRLSEIPTPKAANNNGISDGNKKFIGRDIGFQAQDVLTTAIGGMSPKAIAFQQGSQIAGALQGLSAKEAGGALLTGVTSLISPVSLLSIGLTGLAAAGIQAFMNTTTAAKSLDDVLKDNADSIAVLKDRYGDLADVQASVGNVGGNTFVVSQARNQMVEMQKTMKAQLGDYVGGVNNGLLSGGSFGGSGLSSVDDLRKVSTNKDRAQFADPVSALLESAKSGHADLAAFDSDLADLYAKLSLVSKNPEDLLLTAQSIEAIGRSAFDVTGKFAPFGDAINMLKVKGVDGLVSFNDQVKRMGEEKGLSTLADELISKGADIIKLAQAAQSLKQSLDAIDREDTRPGLVERRTTPGYVARRGVDQTRTNNQFAADQQMARARTNQERLDAVAAQARAQHPTNADEGGGVDARVARAVAAERTRQEVQERDATRDRSLSLDRMLESQKEELSLVGQTGGAAEGLRKQYELIAALQAEAAKTGGIVSPAEVARIKEATAAYGEMFDKINLAKLNDDLDFQGRQNGRTPQQQQIASTLRQNGQPEDFNTPIAQRLKRQSDSEEQKAAIDQFSTNLASNLINSGGKIGKAFGETFLASLQQSSQKALANLFSELFNALLTGKGGAGGAAASGVSAIGAIGSKIFGGSGAANSNIASVGASAASIGASAGLTKTGIPLSAISVGGLTAKVATDAAPQFQGLLNDLKAKGYPITSLGEGGYSYRNVAGTSNLSNHAFGNALDINPRQNPQAPGATGNWAQYGIDPTAEAKQFGMTYGGNWKLPDTMHFQVDKTAQSLDKLTTSSTNATQGLSQVGKLSSSFFPSAPSGGVAGAGGGWLSLLSGSIFSGSSQLKKSGGIGLFASGTDSAPGGMAIVGEKGPELINLPRGSQVIPNHKLGSMAANSNDQAASQQPKYEIHIHGGSGDDHIRGLVNQGIQQADGQRSDQMRRGGVAQLNSRYGNQKG